MSQLEATRPAAPEALTTAVVMCTYNGERFLQAQLDSLLAQTRLPGQIVIRDDLSSDGTLAILEAFAAQARARGIAVDLARNAHNLGYRRNFESALASAGAQVLFLCDQDDVWHPRRIERFMAEFEQRPELALLHCDARLVDADGAPLGTSLFQALGVSRAELDGMHAGDAFAILLRRNLVTGAACAIRARLLAPAMPFPAEGWSHDEWIAMVAAFTERLDTLEEPLLDYRQHDANQMGARKTTLVQRWLGIGLERQAYIAAMVRRLQQLADHVQARGIGKVAQRTELQARLAHARFRSNLPASLVARWRGIGRELSLGHYRRYGSGARSLIADLLDLS